MRPSQTVYCSYLDVPQSQYAERIRTLRIAVIRLVTAGKGCILITSAWPSEGKTTTCINLAACYAELGKRVLLIDGDLRKRTLTRLVPESKAGLADLLKGQEPELVDNALPGVFILGSGDCCDCIYDEMLTSPQLRNWVASQQKSFDLILIDAPPLSVHKDAFLLGKISDGALIVSRASKFRGIPEAHLSEDLRDHGIPIFGIISISKNQPSSKRENKRHRPS